MAQQELVGYLRLKGGEQFSRQLRSKAQEVKKAFLTINNAIAGAGITLFLKRINEAANQATSGLMGLQSVAEFKGIQGADKAVRELEAVKLGLLDVSDASMALKNLLARGYNLEQAVQALNRLSNAAAFGRQSSLSLGEAVKSASEGLKNENSILVDNAGVTKNVSVMWAEYAKQIGKGVKQLTLQEKIQAEVNGLMRETQGQVGDLTKLANSAAGQQAKLAAQTRSLSVAFGKLFQELVGPVISKLTLLAKFFAESPPHVRNFAAAVIVAAAALKLFGGALTALKPAMGPVGWIVAGITLVISAFGLFQSVTSDATDSLKKFREEAAQMNLQQLQKQWLELTIEQQRLQQEEDRIAQRRKRALEGQATEEELLALRMASQRSAFRRARLAELARQLELTGDMIQKHQKQNAEKFEAAARQETRAAKERADNHIRFQFETNKISREQYIAYLRQRRNDFTKWSNEWLNLHKELLRQESLLNAERERAAAQTEKHSIKIRTDVKKILPQQLERAEFFDDFEERMSQLRYTVTDIVSFIRNATENIAFYFTDAFDPVAEGTTRLRAAMKEILLTVVDALNRYIVLAKIKTILDAVMKGVFGLGEALAKAAPLAVASGLLTAARGQIAAMADGGIVTRPTLALIGENPRTSPEIVAPKQDFLSYSRQLIDEVLGGGRGKGDVQIVQNFQTPLQDRRAARAMAEQVLKPEIRRERKRAGRFINKKVLS